jgi:hypothetical protein
MTHAAPTADEGARRWGRILNCGGNSLNEPSSPLKNERGLPAPCRRPAQPSTGFHSDESAPPHALTMVVVGKPAGSVLFRLILGPPDILGECARDTMNAPVHDAMVRAHMYSGTTVRSGAVADSLVKQRRGCSPREEFSDLIRHRITARRRDFSPSFRSSQSLRMRRSSGAPRFFARSGRDGACWRSGWHS